MDLELKFRQKHFLHAAPFIKHAVHAHTKVHCDGWARNSLNLTRILFLAIMFKTAKLAP